MKYLKSQKLVHRDLSLRNILLTTESNQYIVKIGDFGLRFFFQFFSQAKIFYLSRVVSDYYRTNDRAIPIKWAAPEVRGFSEVLQLIVM